MKKNLFVAACGVAALLMTSCGSSKSSQQGYYNPYEKQQEEKPVFMKKQETREVDKLAAAEKDCMRAVGIGNDYSEKEARREAMDDARNTLASYIEQSVVSLTTEYNKKSTVNKKKVSEGNREGVVEYTVAQKVNTRLVGVPEIYTVSDGSVQVYVCLELTKPTQSVLGDVYDDLSKEDILGIDYDKEKFIKDNMDRIQQLREKVK